MDAPAARTGSGRDESGDDLPLSLADIKEAREARRQSMPARRSQEGHPLTHGLLAKRVAADAAASTAEGASPFRMVINLDGERLTHVPQDVCHGMEPAARLNLQGNSLTDMRFLSTLTNLQSLNLAHNRVTQVCGIRGLTQLVELDLTHNLITEVDVNELPPSIQKLQLQGNPVGLEQPELLAKLLAHLTCLQRLNDSTVPLPLALDPSNSSSTGSAGSTNEMVEAALKELHIENVVLGDTRLADLVTKSPLWSATNPNPGPLPRKALGTSPVLSRSNSRVAQERAPSPVRVTPSPSRQNSVDMVASPSCEALEVLARVRDALPKVREASDVGYHRSETFTVASDRRALSVEGVAGYAGFRRTNSEGAGARNNRAISLPHPSKGSLHPRLGQFTANTVTDGHRFPLLATPTSYAEDASAFQGLLSAAISTLVGSSGPPREVAFTSTSEEVSVWAQGQHHRQQVLDSLFAKRRGKAGMLRSGNSRKALGTRSSKGGEDGPKPRGRAPLKRADSTISKHRRAGVGGSAVNEEMLKGLELRDPPRAEGLSEALQGPPTQPPGEQLASLSQNATERQTAEQVRMCLRRGVQRMLDNAQQQRELEPSNVAAMVGELNKLKQMKSLQSLLAVREGHMPPQPQVLASIVGAHSRLGSITERLAQALPTLPVLDTEPMTDATPHRPASVQHAGPGAVMPSPFAPPSQTSSGDKSISEPNPPSQRQFLKPHASNVSSSSSSSSDATSSSAGTAPLKRQTTQAMPSSMRPSERPPVTRGGSQRRLRPPQPSSPSSDAEMDPEPPVDRQSSRPIFGGIAKMVRNPSGQMEPPPSPIPSTARAPSGRINTGKMQLTNKMGSQSQRSSPFGGSGAVLNLNTAATAPLEAERSSHQVPRGIGMARANTLEQPRSMHEGGSKPNSPEFGAVHRGSSSEEKYGSAQLRAKLEADKHNEKVQSELWDRFSGGGGAAARQLQPRSADEASTRKSVVFSPFSAVSAPAASPFSAPPPALASLVAATPGAAEGLDARQDLSAGTRVKSWHPGDRIAVSPFAKSGLPYITRPPPNPLTPNVQGGQSAPPIPATEITARIEEVNKRDVPESYSAPPGTSLRKVLREAVEAHEKETAEQEKQGVDKGEMSHGGDIRGGSAKDGAGASPGKGPQSEKQGEEKKSGVAVESLAGSHLHDSVAPAKSPFGEMPGPGANPGSSVPPDP